MIFTVYTHNKHIGNVKSVYGIIFYDIDGTYTHEEEKEGKMKYSITICAYFLLWKQGKWDFYALYSSNVI